MNQETIRDDLDTHVTAALLRHPELVEQIKADLAEPSRAAPSDARRPRRNPS